MSVNRTASGREIYTLSGGRGRCYVCQVEFTSDQNANQHLSGQKHMKKVAAFDVGSAITDSGSFRPLVLPSTSSIFPSPLISTSLNSKQLSNDTGLLPGVNQFSKVSNSQQLGPNGEPYIMNGSRGTCFVCNVQLTSKEHAHSHLNGQKHQKKYAAVGGLDKIDNVNSASGLFPEGRTFLASGVDPTTQAVLMCAICNAPFSCIDNATEHFRSEKHKKKVRLWEAQQLANNTNNTPQTSDIGGRTVQGVPGVISDPETTPKRFDSPPVQYKSTSLAQTTSELITSDQNVDAGEDTIPKILDSSVLHLMSTPGSVLHFPPSFSMPTCSDNVSQPPVFSSQQTNIPRDSESDSKEMMTLSMPTYSGNLSHIPVSPSQQTNRWTDCANAKQSKEMNNSNSEKVLNCNISSGLKDIGKFKNKELALSQSMFQRTTSSSGASTISSGASTISSGACSSITDNCLQNLHPQQKTKYPVENQAPLKFTSLPGSSNIELRDLFQSSHGVDPSQESSSTQLGLPPNPLQGESQIPLGLGSSILSPPELLGISAQGVSQLTYVLNPNQVSPLVQPGLLQNQLQDKADESIQPVFSFNGQRGHCNACNVELTSQQLADQHLNGQKHHKRAAQWELSQQRKITQPAPSFSQHITALTQQMQIKAAAPPQASPADSPINVDNDVPDTTCYFNGCRGFCTACNIEITSRQHYDQHRLGKPHSRSRNRYLLSQQGLIYPLFCDVCKKPFTGQESAKQHFESARHSNKVKIFGGEGQHGGREVERLETGRVIMKDSEVWFVCDICDSRFNTNSQYESHLQGDKHKKAVIIAAEDGGSEASSRGQSPYLGSVAHDSPRASLDHQDVERILADNAQHLKYLPQTPINNAPLPQKVKGGFNWPSASHSAESTQRETTPRSNIPKERYGVAEGFTPQNREEFSPGQNNNSGFNSFGPGMSATPVRWSSGGQHAEAGSAGGSGGRMGEGNPPGYRSEGPYKDNEAGSGETPVVARIYGRCDNDDTGEGQGVPGDLARGGRESHDHGNLTKKPQAPHRSMSRPTGVGRLVSNMDYTKGCDFEEESSEYLHLKEQPRPNICEEAVSGSLTQDMRNLTLADRAEAEQAAGGQQVPEASPTSENEEFIVRSSKPGCLVECKLCKQHMNSLEALDSHLKGKYHLYNISMRPAPVRTLPPIKKDVKDVVKRAYEDLVEQTPRVYQVDLLCNAMERDTVIYLPTGTGKTLVAVMAICMMLQDNRERPVLFLVDKVLLVLQQEKYIRTQIGSKRFKRPNINRDGTLVERELLIKVICGGLFSKSEIPVWQHDIVVTTADFCLNMLDKKLIRWEDFSLVVLDEVHHCNKNHPYFKLLSNHPPTQRLQRQASGLHFASLNPASMQQSSPKILGLSASPASKRSIDDTYNNLKQLLANLGGAQIAMVTRKEAENNLKHYESNTNIHVKCVPMSSRETEFTQKLLEYFVLCYVKLASLCPVFKKSELPFSYFASALSGTQDAIKKKAESLRKDFEPVQDLLPYLLSQTYSGESPSAEILFTDLKDHMLTVIMCYGDVAVFSNNVAETLLDELKPSPKIQDFEDYGLPCSEFRKSVSHFAETGSSDMTMQNKLLETLMDPSYIDWNESDCKVLVLVQRRHEARVLANVLKNSEFVKSRSLRVTHLVGHGRGAQDGGMDVRKQKKLLDNAGKYHLFVATSIMEEGVDFQSLQLVVCLNPPTSVRALVQIRGRARKRDSHFVILCKEEEEEKKLNTLMDQEQNMKWAAMRCLAEAGQSSA